MAVDNLWLLEAILRTRLAEQLADLVPRMHVLSAADLAGVTEATQPTPAVHLVYQGYRVVESRGDGRGARLEQTWLATVATRNVRDLRTGIAARVDAGQIAARVAGALMGFKPTPASKPLRLVDAPAAGYSDGFAYMPLAFVAELVIESL
jgi:hypothetical protein